MGCDIHMHVEYRDKVFGYWCCGDYFKLRNGTMAYNPKYDLVELYGNRSYTLFSILANVRNIDGLQYISLPKGLPEDATDITKTDYESWGMDAHSCSYLTLKEIIDFREIYDWDEYHMLDIIIDRLRERADELNVIYDFQWINNSYNKAYEQSDQIRIVFWFDN